MGLGKVLDWFMVRDYDRAKQKAAAKVAARFARGNVFVQNGWFMDRAKLNRLSASGNAASAALNKKVARA